jgi:hypothetical protein
MLQAFIIYKREIYKGEIIQDIQNLVTVHRANPGGLIMMGIGQ